jgi:hypothetical protein
MRAIRGGGWSLSFPGKVAGLLSTSQITLGRNPHGDLFLSRYKLCQPHASFAKSPRAPRGSRAPLSDGAPGAGRRRDRRRLLHGANNIHGWGQDASVDQRLLFVTGFDPASGTFHYRVNQHFGAASGALNPFRVPFVLSLQARMTLGGRH